MSNLINRQDVIDAVMNTEPVVFDVQTLEPHQKTKDVIAAIEALPSAEPDMAENLYLYKCYITDKDGLQHEVIHTGDIRRVTGWEI